MNETFNPPFKRGQVWWLKELSIDENIQTGCRPALIVSNNIGNKYAPILTIVPITTKIKPLPTHVSFINNKGIYNIILTEQIRTINKTSMRDYIETLSELTMKEVDIALKTALGIPN